MLKVGVVGASGYTGIELVKLLIAHPEVKLVAVTSNAEQGKPVAEIFPALRLQTELSFYPHDTPLLMECDVIFFASPHATAMHQIPHLYAEGKRIIDLSADFRIKDAQLWQEWYGVEHACPELLAEAVYGLPELNREAIKSARLVANPGCYPTAVSLALMPLLKENAISLDNIIADAKSGVSGAGRQAKIANLYAEANESFKAYGVSGHRHLPEIQQTLTAMHGDESVGLTFIPHLVPMNRGILATVYANLLTKGLDLQNLYESTYATEAFVDVMPSGSLPTTASVTDTNYCRISVNQITGQSKVVIVSVIDNLIKGAAGQAVQNMNIMYGFAEDAALTPFNC